MREAAKGGPGRGRAGGASNFVIRNRKTIVFLVIVLCLAGVYAAFDMPSSVFPQTDFPRVVILIDNGVMPSDEMMATITRPVEEAMKNIPGTRNIRSATGRGSAEVNVFFDWGTDMVQAELYVLGRLAQIRSTLPPTAEFEVHRLTFSAFPILGISLTSGTRSITELWETARYELYPRFLRIPGVARIKLVGGRRPEYHVVVDPDKLAAYKLSIDRVREVLGDSNQYTPTGMHEENHQLYLGIVDSRVRDPAKISDLVLAWREGGPVRVKDVASVRKGEAPQFNIVTADGRDAVLLNIYSQPDGNTVAIADALERELARLRKELPPDMRLAFFYDQSLFVREGVRSVWESIFFGLILSMLVLLAFLKNPGTTLTAAVVIPVTVLITLVGMRLARMSFNLMTLGGIAAAIGLVIDDAIVMVEEIYAKVQSGLSRREAVGAALREVGPPLVGSTLTPVVVFLPLAFLVGVAGVFFRALALTMVFALLTSLALAVTWTPALGSLLIRKRKGRPVDELEQGGPVLKRLVALYEWTVRKALGRPVLSTLAMVLVVAGGVFLYGRLPSGFLPDQDEGAFVLDYFSRPGTSLSETNRMLQSVERILREDPAVESFSRRTGARLALAIAEPNTGDFLVKLRPGRKVSTEEVIRRVRRKIRAAEPALHMEFPGVLSDLIGDLTWSPKPVEVKIFSTDTATLKRLAGEIARLLEKTPGVVDVNDGLVVAGPSLVFRVRLAEAFRAGLTPRAIGDKLRTALLGDAPSYILEGDRTVGVRVLVKPSELETEQRMQWLSLRAPGGEPVSLASLARVSHRPGILEMHREDLRQLTAVTSDFEGMDLGTGMAKIRRLIRSKVKLPEGVEIEYGGLFEQQQESFKNLALVLLLAVLLVYLVLLVEFREFLKPLAIIAGSVLALFGVCAGLWVTGISLNIVSFLGAIIGVGIVAKNGILMLDYVEHLEAKGLSTLEALVFSGRRRLRPVVMTSLTAFLGLAPLAVGVGAGADMLRPLAVGVMGALIISMVLSLVATPAFYYLALRLLGRARESATTEPEEGAIP